MYYSHLDLCDVISISKFTLKRKSIWHLSVNIYIIYLLSYLPTPPLGQDMTQGQFLSGV